MMNLGKITKDDLKFHCYEPIAGISTGDNRLAEPMPIKAKPYAHQIIGYNMACRILMITKGGD